MTRPSSTARHGRGCISCPNGSDAEEDRGGGSGDRDNGTPDNRRSGEECDNRSELPATAVNPLDSAKRVYHRWWEVGVWRNDATVRDEDGNDSGVVEERHQRGGEVADAARRLEHLAALCRPPILSHRERIAQAVHENRVVILAG